MISYSNVVSVGVLSILAKGQVDPTITYNPLVDSLVLNSYDIDAHTFTTTIREEKLLAIYKAINPNITEQADIAKEVARNKEVADNIPGNPGKLSKLHNRYDFDVSWDNIEPYCKSFSNWPSTQTLTQTDVDAIGIDGIAIGTALKLKETDLTTVATGTSQHTDSAVVSDSLFRTTPGYYNYRLKEKYMTNAFKFYSAYIPFLYVHHVVNNEAYNAIKTEYNAKTCSTKVDDHECKNLKANGDKYLQSFKNQIERRIFGAEGITDWKLATEKGEIYGLKKTAQYINVESARVAMRTIWSGYNQTSQKSILATKNYSLQEELKLHYYYYIAATANCVWNAQYLYLKGSSNVNKEQLMELMPNKFLEVAPPHEDYIITPENDENRFAYNYFKINLNQYTISSYSLSNAVKAKEAGAQEALRIADYTTKIEVRTMFPATITVTSDYVDTGMGSYAWYKANFCPKTEPCTDFVEPDTWTNLNQTVKDQLIIDETDNFMQFRRVCDIPTELQENSYTKIHAADIPYIKGVDEVTTITTTAAPITT